jgi:hypothetical protein
MHTRTYILLLLATSLLASCAEGDVGGELGQDAANLRSVGPTGPGPRIDMGSHDTGPGLVVEDMSTVEPDQATCSEICTVGMRRCDPGGVATCAADTTDASCSDWGAPIACPADQVCVAGACETPVSCVDNDGDGYGAMCAPGPDCDDTSDATNPGAIEICDGADNDCNGTTDDGFDVGGACTTGSGNCEAQGNTVCASDGTTTCDATPPNDPELCDGIDNDCDGVVDDGVCGVCQTDIFEPNDLPADAELVQVDSPKWGYTCPGDTDWFELETQTGVQYHVYVTFPESQSDLLVEGWVDGVNVITGDTTARDYEEFIVNGDAAKTFQIEVIDRDNLESFFRISLVADANCVNEDGFVPNQTIAEAAQLPAFWTTQAYMCSGGLSDWFYLGDRTVGEALDIGIVGESFGTDLDLHLWGDPDGDNVFELVNSSTNFDNIEDITMAVPYSGPFYFEVRDFDGLGGYYDVGWSVQ